MKLLQYLSVICLVLATGCGDGTLSMQERLKLLVPDAKATVPVSGAVLVDGKPIPDLWVSLVPKGTKLAKNQQAESRAQTDKNGSYQIMTYIEGDGAPAGEYSVCVEWLQYRQTGARWIGPDKLGNRYSDPAKSKFSVTVANDAVQIPTLELTSK